MFARMHTLIRSAVVWSTLTCISLTALAGTAVPPGKPPAERNAALVYWKTWTMVDDQALKMSVDWSAIGDNLDPAKMPAEFNAAVQGIASRRDSIDSLMKASEMPVCDFELAYEDGFQLLLPHLSKFRAGSRLLRIDARRLLMENHPREAALRVAAMLRCSRQLRNEGVLISSLVAMAIADNALDEAQVLLSSGRLTARDAQPIAAALEPLAEPDSLGVRACIAGEGEIMQTWIARKFTGPTAGKDFVDGWIDAMQLGATPPGDHAARARQQVRAMDAAALAAEVHRVIAAYRLVDAAWETADAATAIERITESAGRGEYGPLGVLVFPGFAKSRRSVEKFDARVAEVSRQLEVLR